MLVFGVFVLPDSSGEPRRQTYLYTATRATFLNSVVIVIVIFIIVIVVLIVIVVVVLIVIVVIVIVRHGRS